MPWAHDDIRRNQVDSGSSSISGGFPFSKIVLLTVNQPIPPHQHLDVTIAHEMSVNLVDGLCEESATVFALRRWRKFGAQQKNLIHADVKGVRMKRVNDLVHQLKYGSPNGRVEWIPLAAIDTLVVGERSRREIEGWVDRE